MLNVKKWLAMFLALSLLFNLIPLNVLADELSQVTSEQSQVVDTENTNLELSSEAVAEIQSVPEEENGAPAEGGETSGEGTGAPAEGTETPGEETGAPAEGTETPGEGTGAPAEGTETPEEGNDTPAEGDETPDESENVSAEVEETNNSIALYTMPTDPYAKAFAERLIGAGYATAEDIGKIIDESGTGIKLNISGAEKGQPILILLSNMDLTDCDYSNWTIYFDSTGSLNLTGAITVNETREETVANPETGEESTQTITEPKTYSFRGFGGEGKPFTGKFTGQTISFQISQTLFKELSVTAELNNNSIEWSGTEDKPILAKTLIADTAAHELTMALASATRFSPYIGKLNDGSGLVTLPTLDYSEAASYYSNEYPTTQGNLSLVCNSMAANTALKVTALSLPERIDLRGTGNVGTLVGEMAAGAQLHIANSLNLNARPEGEKAGGLEGESAGGLVGSMEQGAAVHFDENVSVCIDAEIKAANAGGIAGSVTTVTGPLGTNANVVLNSVKANGTNNAGVLYGICTATGDFKPLTGVSFGEGAVREVSGPGNCGGLFGTLTLQGDGKCTILGESSTPLSITSKLISATNNTRYGGIAGELNGDAHKNALVVDYCDITATVGVPDDGTYYPKYLGGAVADQQTVTLDIGDSTIQVQNPKTKDADNCGFGGVVASVGNGALLIAENMAIKTNTYETNKRGGGVAGLTGVGSIVYLKTSLDLSGCQLFTNATSGQIVGSQDCSLIYAPGVDITRLDATVDGKSVKGMELDDIGNYGELYRISGLLTVADNTYEKTFHTITGAGNAYTISNAVEYACLALAWQSRGAFHTVDGINNGNWSVLKSSTITLGDNIDLTNCGIGGLTRDYDKDSANDTFTGTFNGNDRTLTLDIGAKNSFNSVSNGDGRIYWHNSTGLFAALNSRANVSNLNLAGNIHLSNNKLTSGMYSGALAAQVTGTGTAESSMLSKVSTSVKYDATVNGGYTLYLGGLIGQISASDTNITFDSGTSLAAEITLSSSGVFTHIGGAIGAIGESSSATITCAGATLGGKIEGTGNNVENLYAGGLIGTIWPASSKKREISINNLNVTDFIFSGNAKQRMGGILGGIWADTDVTLAGLTVSNTTLTAKGAAALGGLVYRASGKWAVSSVDLSGLTISASNASALGLMVCHGEPYTEPINGDKAVGGLYLQMTAPWDTAYIVPTAPASISVKNDCVFDEFVAYTAYRYSDTGYDITHNGSGIISLQTTGNTVNMEEEENRNTYVNRTDVATTTNKCSRYYYNLPTVLQQIPGPAAETEARTDWVDSADALLIWSVYRYAASNLKPLFSISGMKMDTNKIGGTTEKSANFDMVGLSYYPVDIGAENIILQYADVTFHNKKIEDKETPEDDTNKSTRVTDSGHTQHYTMHCALFHDFEVESTKTSTTYTLTVNGVTFAGTVGVVNGGSGALICGKVEGLNNGTNTAVCKVVLADEDNSTQAVKLSGISVDPTADYCPVLINSFADYSALEANYITTERTAKAGSSLFGKVEKSDGKSAAVNVSIVLEGTIKLDETKDAVFTKATLFHSLHFSDGSASYNFNKSKDYDGSDKYTHHSATHGNELAGGKSVEYAGLLGNYLDSGEIPTAGLADYLPYVAHSPATLEDVYKLENNWHEVAVNVRFKNLTGGCGTYGHPYMVDADTLTSMANYINTGRASNGWQLCVPANLDTTSYHTESNRSYDIVVTYQNGKFLENGGKEYRGEGVRKHLQSAVYQLKEDIVLNNFGGIGSKDTSGTAFKGVIYGNNHTITLSGGSSSFIKYSYGSVVRDVKFILNQKPTLNRSEPTRPNGVTEAKRAPDTFFGGVIGCVLGGDNIIENVTVSNFSVNLTGSKSHLVPIGGHVGVIAGGGVIFRGTCTSGYAGEDTNYYRNPFIGRVLGGYAFYEGTGTVPDNGNKDYKINKITPSTNDLNWEGSTLTVKNAQGLLVLSAIVSSGAGRTQSVAYANGVARNAAYNKIGKPESEAKDDFGIAKLDKAGTASYLLRKFSNCTECVDFCTQFATKEGISIQFANTTFNMKDYGNGYRGLSARYVSNAAYKIDGADASTNGVDASTVVLRVKSFDGQNATVQNISMDVKEYADDDFHAASMGGIFNIVWTNQNGGGVKDTIFAQNLTLLDCVVSLQYVKENRDTAKQADSSSFVDADGLSCVAVGGFIGSVSDVGTATYTKTITGNYLFTNLTIKGSLPEPETGQKKSRITGPNSAGGLIGASAMTGTYATGYPGALLSNKQHARFGPNFLNCTYSNVEITAKIIAGGLIGTAYAYTPGGELQFGSVGYNYIASSNAGNHCFASCTVTNDLPVGQSSDITAVSQHGVAGGIFGIVGMRVGVNYSGTTTNVETETGLTIADSQDMKQVSLNSVNVYASKSNDILYRSSGNKVNGPDSNENNAVSGGIVGRISNVNPAYFYDISLNECNISCEKASFAYAGGIAAYGYTNTTIMIQRCKVEKTTVTGAFAGGAVAFCDREANFALHLSDFKLEESNITGRTRAGGIVGAAGNGNNATKQTHSLFNVLIKNTSISATGKNGTAGRLYGLVHIVPANNNVTFNAVGISVVVNKPGVTLPDIDVYYDPARTFNGNIVYADYLGTETPVGDNKSPYVTVNPNFTLTGADKTLYGDAVGQIDGDTEYNSVAARIWADSKTGATGKKNLASYAKASAIVNAAGKTAPEVSTFQEVQGCGPDNLPVLTIKNGGATAIEDYLNVITNGGYGKMQKSHNPDVPNTVSLSVSVYEYQKDSDTFTKVTTFPEDALASVYLDGTTIKVRGNSYDNTRNRFSLVEAAFTVEVNGENRTYTVSVPVMVIRQLQYTSMVTFTYGAEFKASAFENLTTHVLESTGNPFTAYLSYRYNQEYDTTSETGAKYAEYDWQSYLDSGGNMLSVDKILTFSTGLPNGTQIILVDCQDGNRAYQYKTMGYVPNIKTEIRLSDFTSVSNGTTPFQPSMADVLRVEPVGDANGGFVALGTGEAVSAATVRRNGVYYRPYDQDTDSGKRRWLLKVPTDLDTNVPIENYFLVINVPDQNDPAFYINGKLTTALDWNMPNSGTQIRRSNQKEEDKGNDNESTYQISAGYTQNLVPTRESKEPINLLDPESKIQVALTDTITFSREQAYGDNDALFVKFAVSLDQYARDNMDKETSEEGQFPVGTRGTVYFYIQDSQNDYYKSDGKTETEKTPIGSYQWISQGGKMELLLSADGKQALDLAKIRQAIKGNQTLEPKIVITAKMDVVFDSQDVLNRAVPASDSAQLDKWAQLHYTALVATQASSLDYTANRTAKVDEDQYYRGIAAQAVLSMDGVEIDQLGVNPLQLVEAYQEPVNNRKASRIDMTAALNLENLPNYQATLQKTTAISFSLSLLKRIGSDYVQVTPEETAQSRIAFRWQDGSTAWNWRVSRNSAGQFVDSQGETALDLYDSGKFTFPLTAYVFTDQTDYANYKIQLRVDFTLNDSQNSIPTNQDDAYVVYTYACIKPSFYEPTEGSGSAG